MALKVRAALPCDTEGVLRCLAEFHVEHQLVEEDGGTGERFDAEEYARWLPCGSDAASTEQAFTFVADGAGEICGVLLLCADSTLHELPAVGAHWDIAELYVAPAVRGGGVGGQLLEEAVRWCARDARFALLEASSASANVRASRFYVTHGFGVAAREVRFRDREVRPHGPHTVHLHELAAPAFAFSAAPPSATKSHGVAAAAAPSLLHAAGGAPALGFVPTPGSGGDSGGDDQQGKREQAEQAEAAEVEGGALLR